MHPAGWSSVTEYIYDMIIQIVLLFSNMFMFICQEGTLKMGSLNPLQWLA